MSKNITPLQKRILIALPLLAALAVFAMRQYGTGLMANAGESADVTVNLEIRPPEPVKTVQQQLEETVDCAALLAVQESTLHGQMDAGSPTFNLISYALGKAQELAVQAGLQAGAARDLYEQKTLARFMASSANPQQYMAGHQAQVDDCRVVLQQYEPQAQIQSAIDKARNMAKEGVQPALQP